MGGTTLTASFSPANLLTTCSACNLVRIERKRQLAIRSGWIVPQGMNPVEVPVLRFGTWVRLTDDGGVTPA